MEEKILNFLKELKYSYKKNEEIYTQGSSFRLWKMLNILFDAEPYYSQSDVHWISKINNKFYDINGEITENYVKSNKYLKITEKTILESAYVQTHKKQTKPQHNKYSKTI